MTIQQLKYFVKIVECGSISEAAAKFFVSQPSLSTSIRDLEMEVEKTFFVRSKKGITPTHDGLEFLGYAKQVLQQMELLESRYAKNASVHQTFSVSAHHYLFLARAFGNFVRTFQDGEYELALRETTTHGIIDDVKNLRSELGILYLSNFNRQVITKLLKEKRLQFRPLFTQKAQVFVGRQHPLADRSSVSLDELEGYPCVSYDQGVNNSFYYSEEILSNRNIRKSLIVTDRHTLMNMLTEIDAYTLGAGLSPSPREQDVVTAIPLNVEESIEIGVVTLTDYVPSLLGKRFLDSLQGILKQ